MKKLSTTDESGEGDKGIYFSIIIFLQVDFKHYWYEERQITGKRKNFS